jgi:hypothetical protein
VTSSASDIQAAREKDSKNSRIMNGFLDGMVLNALYIINLDWIWLWLPEDDPTLTSFGCNPRSG